VGPYGRRTYSSSAGTQGPGASSGGGTAVAISGFAFNPGTITVKPGTAVTWTNNDSATHTITADDGSWDSGAVAKGKTFSRAFASAGTYTYHCAVHPSMTGKVIVAP
jgi:plastocyanin